MRKRQRRRESGGVIMHRLHVPVSRGDSVITSPAARGAALDINSTFVIEVGKHRNTVEL
jgi:hypothetical protein